ncbi:MAG: glycoside hydrolase family 28 protein [Thermonemataceae bacterium]
MRTLLYISLIFSLSCSHKKIYKITDFGAKGDGVTLNTKAIQQAINTCAGEGGGVVSIEEGVFLSGSLELKSNVTLRIAKGAVLLGSPFIEDYPTGHFLYAKAAQNIRLEGKGRIEGNGARFWNTAYLPLDRPRPWIEFEQCQRIEVKQLYLRYSPSHTLVFRDCRTVKVQEVDIYNVKRSPNTDGIDLNSTSDVTISNCRINTGDDAICLKAKKPIKNIKVERCTIESDDAGIKFGTSSSALVQNCTFKNINLTNTRYGIALMMLQGGKYEKIVFEDITYNTTETRHKTEYPIFIDIDKKYEDSSLGTIDGVTFRNMRIKTRGKILIAGHPQKKLGGISLQNIEMEIIGSVMHTSLKKPRGNKDLKRFEESADFASISAYVTLAHGKGFSIENLTLTVSAPQNHEKHLFYLNDVTNTTLARVQVYQPIANQEKPLVVMIKGENVTLKDWISAVQAPAFLQVEESAKETIQLGGNKIEQVEVMTHYVQAKQPVKIK